MRKVHLEVPVSTCCGMVRHFLSRPLWLSSVGNIIIFLMTFETISILSACHGAENGGRGRDRDTIPKHMLAGEGTFADKKEGPLRSSWSCHLVGSQPSRQLNSWYVFIGSFLALL